MISFYPADLRAPICKLLLKELYRPVFFFDALLELRDIARRVEGCRVMLERKRGLRSRFSFIPGNVGRTSFYLGGSMCTKASCASRNKRTGTESQSHWSSQSCRNSNRLLTRARLVS